MICDCYMYRPSSLEWRNLHLVLERTIVTFDFFNYNVEKLIYTFFCVDP